MSAVGGNALHKLKRHAILLLPLWNEKGKRKKKEKNGASSPTGYENLQLLNWKFCQYE